MPKRYNRQPSTIIEDEQEDVEDDELLSTDEEQTVRSERDAEPQKRKRIAQNNGTESELLNQVKPSSFFIFLFSLINYSSQIVKWMNQL